MMKKGRSRRMRTKMSRFAQAVWQSQVCLIFCLTIDDLAEPGVPNPGSYLRLLLLQRFFGLADQGVDLRAHSVFDIVAVWLDELDNQPQKKGASAMSMWVFACGKAMKQTILHTLGSSCFYLKLISQACFALKHGSNKFNRSPCADCPLSEELLERGAFEGRAGEGLAQHGCLSLCPFFRCPVASGQDKTVVTLD